MAESTEAAEAAPKKKSKLLIIIVGVVALLGAGVGAYLMLKPTDKAAAAEATHAEPGKIVALDPVTINLADGHYLKMSFALQATVDAAEDPDGSKALDLAIAQYTDKPIAELSTAKGRETAKKELTEKVKKAYVKDKVETVMDLYITQFVTQ